MNILLTGSSGQLGTELFPLLQQLGTVTGLDRAAGQYPALTQDLTDLHQLEVLLNRLRPDLVVNAAAYTAVDQAESDHETAFCLNAELPGRLARWCQQNQGRMLHYSTDYVFDGSANRPYRESDSPTPINTYGESKLAGELAVETSGCPHIVLRTSWVYSTHGKNFVLTMLRLAAERPELSIVSDQSGCPTWARSLARASQAVLKALKTEKDWTESSGIYHYCDATATSWYDFARMIFELANGLGLLQSIPVTRAIESAGFPQPAARPAYSVLDTQKIRERFGIIPPALHESLAACLEDYRP